MSPVALHPERTDDPATVRWQVAGGRVGAVRVDDATVLGRLVSEGVLADVRPAPDHVTTTLGPRHTWAETGAAVRAAVQDAVARWRSAAPAPTDDGALHALAERVLREEVGPYAAGHGGAVELLGVTGGVVHVRLRGACHGCPAAAWTVRGRLEDRLRAEAPWLVGVQVAERLPG